MLWSFSKSHSMITKYLIIINHHARLCNILIHLKNSLIRSSTCIIWLNKKAFKLSMRRDSIYHEAKHAKHKARYTPVMRTSVSLPDKSVICWKLEHHLLISWGWKDSSEYTWGKIIIYTHNEGIIEWCKDVCNAKHMFSITYSRAKGDIFLFGLSGLPLRLHTQPTQG